MKGRNEPRVEGGKTMTTGRVTRLAVSRSFSQPSSVLDQYRRGGGGGKQRRTRESQGVVDLTSEVVDLTGPDDDAPVAIGPPSVLTPRSDNTRKPLTRFDRAIVGAAEDGQLAKVRQLHESGVDLESTDPFQDTVLIMAAYCNDNAIVEYCIANNSNVDAANDVSSSRKSVYLP